MSIEGLGKVGNNDPPFRESESCSVQSPLLWKGQKPSFFFKTRFLYDAFDCGISSCGVSGIFNLLAKD